VISIPPPLPAGNATGIPPRRGIPPRKLVLVVILGASILFVLLMLFAGGIAILREAAPHGHAGLARLVLGFRHIIAHYLSQYGHL